MFGAVGPQAEVRADPRREEWVPLHVSILRPGRDELVVPAVADGTLDEDAGHVVVLPTTSIVSLKSMSPG